MAKNYLPMPYITETNSKGSFTYDIFSMNLKNRIVFVQDEVETDGMNLVVAELLYLDSIDHTKPIYMYINSPGGSITDGLALIDTMNYIQAPIYTISMGMSASMGAAILSCGTKGHRYALPNATIMTHQAAGGYSGKVPDAEKDWEYLKALNTRLAKIIAKNCGMTYDKYMKTVDRDNFMFAEDALKYGIIDKIISKEELSEADKKDEEEDAD